VTYYVQAHRKGQQQVWFTDSKGQNLTAAIAAATRLHLEWDRKVRVVDDDEVVYLRLPPRKKP